MDWNSDGKKDLVVGESYDTGRVMIFLNLGTDAEPVFYGSTYLQVGGADFTSVNEAAMPDIADWNNDGRKDILVGGMGGQIYLLLNTGTDTNPIFAASTVIQDGAEPLFAGFRATPAVCDWNSDGRKDLLVSASDGHVYYYENRGSDSNPAFKGSVRLQAGGATINVGQYARLDVADMDGDGIEDLLVGNMTGNVVYFHAVGANYARLEPAGYFVDDSDGNTNGLLDPGETVRLIMAIANYGRAAENVAATMSEASSYLTLVNSHSFIGTIGSNSQERNFRQPFVISVATNAAPGMWYSLRFSVRGDHCYSTNYSYDLRVGSYTQRPATFAWEDMTAGATDLQLTNGGYASGDFMGFVFPFYGQACSTVYVSDNGFVTFDANLVDSYWNDRMPRTRQPNAVIAPYWEDLVPTGGITRCKQFGSAPDRRWVMEWNQMKLYYMPTADGYYTFQLVLYEDGRIKFQYGALNGAMSNGASATVGMENFEGDTGIEHSCNAAGSVVEGMALEFAPAGGTVDDMNRNGMSDAYEIFYFGDTNADAGADSDADGLSNMKEMFCGTDPMNSSSVLRMESVAPISADACALSWQAIAGRPYYLDMRTSMVSGAWTSLDTVPIYGDTTGTGRASANVPQSRAAFFRVRAR